MNGVTIIAEHTVKDYGDGWILPAILAGIGALLTMWFLIWVIKYSREVGFDVESVMMIGIASLVFLVFGGMCAVSAKRAADNSTHTEYTVVLDESASYLEFTKKVRDTLRGGRRLQSEGEGYRDQQLKKQYMGRFM